jgi:hypothetical protein
MLTLHDIPTLDRWTPIAQRHRFEEDAKWSDIEGAPLSLARATQLREEGALLQALQYDGNYVIVVVRSDRERKIHHEGYPPGRHPSGKDGAWSMCSASASNHASRLTGMPRRPFNHDRTVSIRTPRRAAKVAGDQPIRSST